MLRSVHACAFDPSRRSRLTRHDLGRFPGESLFERVARVLCEAECVPRKELYESWEVARRVRRRFRGGRVVDLACGTALVAHMALLLDDSSPCALAADVRLPASAPVIAEALSHAWPRLAGRVTLAATPIDEVPLGPDDVVVSVHACGAHTDEVLARAITARAASRRHPRATVAALEARRDGQSVDRRRCVVDGGLRRQHTER
jgi:hypothetical protein